MSDVLVMPESAVAAPEISDDASEAFAHHVAHARECGDALDVTAKLESFRRSQLTYLAGATAIANLVAVEAGPGSGIGQYIGVGGVTYFSSLSINLFRKRRLGRRVDEHSYMADIDESYELWRVENDHTGQPEVVMQWHGSTNRDEEGELLPSALSRSLSKMASLAAQNDIKAVIISPTLLKEVSIASAFAEPNERLDIRLWANKKKQRQLRITAEPPKIHLKTINMLVEAQSEPQPVRHQNNFVFTAEKLELLAKTIEKTAEIDKDTQKTVELLRSRKPEHPLVGTYDRYLSTPELQSEKLTAVAKQCVSRSLDDVSVTRNVTDEGMYYKQKVHIQGRIMSDTAVQWLHEGKLFDRESLEKAVGMTFEQARDITTNPDQHPDMAIVRAIELLMAADKSMLHNNITDEKTLVPDAKGLIQLQSARAQIYMIGQRSYDERGREVRTLPTRRRVTTAALGVLAVMFTSLVLTSVDQQFDKEYAAALKQELKLEKLNPLGGSFDNLSKSQKARVRTAIASTPVGKALQTYNDAEKAQSGLIDGMLAKIPSPDASPSDEKLFRDEWSGYFSSANVGNVDPSNDNIINWKIIDPLKLSRGAYWSSQVMDGLTRDGQWGQVLDEPRSLVNLPLHPSLPDSQLIKVIGDPRVSTGGTLLEMPVMDGTEIVAGSIQGKPVTRFQSDSGTQYLEAVDRTYNLRTGNSWPNQEVVYWLKPTKLAPIVHIPKHSELTAENVAAIEKDNVHYPTADVRKQWDKLMPNLTTATPKQRLEAETKYVQNAFKYSFDPLSNSLANNMARGKFDVGTFTSEVLDNKEANCNVAATLVALDNPSVRPATGYFDNGDGYLKQGERHMWLVDKTGNRYDPTPSTMADSKSTDRKSELETLWKEMQKYKYLAAAIGIGAVGYRSRRFLAKIAAHQAVKSASAGQLSDALHTANTVMYAKDISSGMATHASRSAVGKDDAIVRLASPNYHHSSTKLLLRDTAKTADLSAKRSIRQARLVLWAIGKTQPIRSPYDVDDVRSVL